MGFKWYKQKIQWVFPVWNEEGEAAGIARVISILKVLGVRNITEINFMEKNFKRVNTCSGYVQYPESIAVKKAAAYIRKYAKEHPEIEWIEILKR